MHILFLRHGNMNKKFSFLILEEEWEKEENGDEATTEKNPEMVAEEFQKPKTF